MDRTETRVPEYRQLVNFEMSDEDKKHRHKVASLRQTYASAASGSGDDHRFVQGVNTSPASSDTPPVPPPANSDAPPAPPPPQVGPPTVATWRARQVANAEVRHSWLSDDDWNIIALQQEAL